MLVKSLIVTLCVIGVALAEQSPVFLWGANRPEHPALKTVSQVDFAAVLSELLQDHMVVAFQENGLTIKDFRCSKSEQSCYAQLRSVSPKTYFNSIENPAEALRDAAAEHEFNSIDKDGQLARPLECGNGKAVLVTFDTVGETREETLLAHDSAIATITKQNKCKTVYLYLATPGTSSAPIDLKVRSRRDASTPVGQTAAASGGYYFRAGNQFLIFFQSIQLNSGTGQTTTITINSMTVTNASDTQFSVSLATSDAKSVTFDIVKTTDGYYNLKDVAYNNNKFRSNGVNAPTTFSYYCGNLTLNAISTETEPNTNSLIWQNVQFQAPFSAATSEKFVFGDPWHCVGFFTPGILSGLFVILLLLTILFIGICWMMDINTMDRFDDPKGKTITISATE